MSLTTITLSTAHGPREVLAETTINPHLFVAPQTGSDGALTGPWLLTHAPTGKCLPLPLCATDPRAIHAFVERITDLDWSPTEISEEVKQRFFTALRAAEQWEPTPDQEPTTSPFGIPRHAGALLGHLLDCAEGLITLARDTPLTQPDGGPNPRWEELVARRVDNYGLIYLLAVLRHLDPDAADNAAAALADAWDAGDGLDEWLWQWRHQLSTGQPLTLHGALSATTGPLLSGVSTPHPTTPTSSHITSTRTTSSHITSPVLAGEPGTDHPGVGR